jgi:hypothetical protein
MRIFLETMIYIVSGIEMDFMGINEDCISFECDHKNVYGSGSCDAENIPVPGCELNKMAVNGCPIHCLYYLSK